MHARILRMAVVVGAVGALGLSGCSWFGGDPEPTASSTVTASPTASPEPTKTSEPKPATGPTVAGLGEHLDGIINVANGSGGLTCEGGGTISADDAVKCSWLADAFRYPDGRVESQRESPVYVVVLDDSGRYTFRQPSEYLGSEAAVDEYPAGTTDCRTLTDPPPDSDSYRGLSYTSLLYYWIEQGRPASMDDDGNGLPCETVYPAKVVERTIASPLVPGNDSITSHEVRDVVAHLEAVLSGVRAPGTAYVVGADDAGPVLASPAVTGMWFAMAMNFDQPIQDGATYVTVLNDSGRYAFSDGHCCLAGPNPSDYDAAATCKQLSEPTVRPGRASPDAPNEYGADGLSYGNAVYFWRMHGSPARMDGDGDGKPCENVYPVADVSAYFSSTLEP